MFENLNDLYQQVIMDHSRSPRNFRALPTADHQASGRNPLCGDQVTVFVKMNGEVIEDISFQGSGCAIAKASASVMTSALKGIKTISYDFGWAAKNKDDFSKRFAEMAMDLGL